MLLDLDKKPNGGKETCDLSIVLDVEKPVEKPNGGKETYDLSIVLDVEESFIGLARNSVMNALETYL